MTNFEPIDPKDIGKILDKGSTPKKTSRKRPKDYSVRTYELWFSEQHTLGECSNEGCIDPRLAKNGGDRTGALVADIEGTVMCRFCFLEGYVGT